MNIHDISTIKSQIDWNQIEEKLNHYLFFSDNISQINSMAKSTNDIHSRLEGTNHLLSLVEKDSINDLYDQFHFFDEDFNKDFSLTKINKNGVLSLVELNTLILFPELYIKSFQFIDSNFPQFGLNTFNQFKNKFKSSILDRFRSFVSPSGEINFHNHPEIRPLYLKKMEAETLIRSLLNKFLSNPENANIIQFNTIDIINDRYVLPLKSDTYTKTHGQIISRSETGQTFFIEPKQIKDLNLLRLDLTLEIERILNKIERDYSTLLQSFTSELSQIIDFFLYFDLNLARSRFALELNLVRPEINDDMSFDLNGAFHPLIENAIPNDISLSSSCNGIIISGPNTGGKTATLKLLALTQLFLKHGLYIPCRSGSISIYTNIYFFGNDNQNLKSGLSSFAAEVVNYKYLLQTLGETNLILIDEIFNSTSSEEASSLAMSLFKKIKNISHSHIIISSHHQTLKTLLHQDSNYLSAHVGFNIESNTPTYRLHFGSPGASQALQIFHKMTHLDPNFVDIYNDSIHLQDNKVIHYEKLLSSLAQKENELSKQINEQNEINKQLKNQKDSMDGILKLKIEEEIIQFKSKISKLHKKAENTLTAAKSGEIKKVKYIDKNFHEINAEITKLQAPKKDDTPLYENLSTPTSYNLGEMYFSINLKKSVTLKKLVKNNKYGLVSIGAITMQVPLSSLKIANFKGNPSSTSNTQFNFMVEKTRDVSFEYDCRGMRLEEFIDTVEKAIGDLMQELLPYITIIHGHGNGILKNWLRSYIRKNKDIEIIPTQSGNDGETQIKIK